MRPRLIMITLLLLMVAILVDYIFERGVVFIHAGAICLLALVLSLQKAGIKPRHLLIVILLFSLAYGTFLQENLALLSLPMLAAISLQQALQPLLGEKFGPGISITLGFINLFALTLALMGIQFTIQSVLSFELATVLAGVFLYLSFGRLVSRSDKRSRYD